MRQDEFIIKMYLMVDDLYKKLITTPIRKGGFKTQLSDRELICIEIISEFLNLDTDQHIWQYFRQHW